MKVCARCHSTMEDNAFFCGKCGAYIEKDKPYIIDGKKEIKKRKYYKNGFSTKKGSIINLIIYSVVLILAIILTMDTINSLGSNIGNFQNVLQQFISKSKYIMEGLPLRYIYKELITLSTIISDFTIVITSSLIGIYSLYNICVYIYNIHLHNKLGGYYNYNKPIRLFKITRRIRLAFLILLGIMALILLIGLLLDLFIKIS